MTPVMPAYNLEAFRAQVPALDRTIHGRPLVYLDNGATSQTPRVVVEALLSHYEGDRANVHRGVHTLSQRATDQFEAARASVAHFLGIEDVNTVLFTRGTTESINMVAQSWGAANLKPGDEIVVSELEHHANIVPWQMICATTGAKLRVARMEDDGSVPLSAFEAVVGPKTAMVAFAHVSNTLGTVLPVAEICALAHQHGALALVDGAQAAPHMTLNLPALGCDFYVLSAHKIYGPTGIGALWGRRALLEAMEPVQGGGGMIERVTFEKTTYGALPDRFEAGTPHIAGAIGFGAACELLQTIGLDGIGAWEDDLLTAATLGLDGIAGVTIHGRSPGKAAVLSFTMAGAHPQDIGMILDQQGIAIRTGHHCCQPLMDRLGVPGTARASFAWYNTMEEVDRFIAGVALVRDLMG